MQRVGSAQLQHKFLDRPDGGLGVASAPRAMPMTPAQWGKHGELVTYLLTTPPNVRPRHKFWQCWGALRARVARTSMAEVIVRADSSALAERATPRKRAGRFIRASCDLRNSNAGGEFSDQSREVTLRTGK